MTIPLPTLPQPDAYEYLIANVWRTETHFNGVKANDHRCLYSTDKVHAHAAAVSAAKDAEIAKLKTVMVAAAEEIQAYWDAHCDADGYGPVNLMRRLEEGIPSPAPCKYLSDRAFPSESAEMRTTAGRGIGHVFTWKSHGVLVCR